MSHYCSTFARDTFNGKVMVVTGGGSGIGRCVAHELAYLGAAVIITGRTAEKLTRVVDEIEQDGGQAKALVCDNRDEEQVKLSVGEIVQQFGRIDGLVNNAGGQFPAFMAELSLNGFDAVVRNNLHGTFLMMREVYKQSMHKTGGAIVNMTIPMRNGLPGMAHSGASRAGIENMTMSAAIEWAHSGVRVNAVAPGWIVSSGLNSYRGTPVEEMMPVVAESIPMKRFGTESEISALICFLLTPAAAYISGMNVRCDGAATLAPVLLPIKDHERSVPFEAFHRSEVPDIVRPELAESE